MAKGKKIRKEIWFEEKHFKIIKKKAESKGDNVKVYLEKLALTDIGVIG